jgi:hypothetical protein
VTAIPANQFSPAGTVEAIVIANPERRLLPRELPLQAAFTRNNFGRHSHAVFSASALEFLKTGFHLLKVVRYTGISASSNLMLMLRSSVTCFCSSRWPAIRCSIPAMIWFHAVIAFLQAKP